MTEYDVNQLTVIYFFAKINKRIKILRPTITLIDISYLKLNKTASFAHNNLVQSG